MLGHEHRLIHRDENVLSLFHILILYFHFLDAGLRKRFGRGAHSRAAVMLCFTVPFSLKQR